MKIIAINRVSWKSDRAGGSEYRLEKNLKGLSERGHDVLLLCSKDSNLPDYEIEEGVEIKRVGVEEPLTVQNILIPLHYYRKQYNEDILYLNLRSIPWILPSVGGQKIGVFHEKFSRCLSFPWKQIAKFTEFISYQIIERRTPKIAVSKSSSEEINANTVIPIGFDPEKFERKEKFDKPSVCFVGRIRQKKGVEMLPEIYDNIQKQIDIDFHVIGGSPEERLDNILKEKSSNSEGFKYHGHLSLEEKNKIVSKSWVQVVPSNNEGWGMVVTEASFLGTPVVASDVRGLRDSVHQGENGFLVDRSPVKFSDKVIEILENPEPLYESSIGIANKYTMEKMVEKTESFMVKFIG